MAPALRVVLAQNAVRLRRLRAARNRLLLVKTRHDTRVWHVKRRERTRPLIELGGLVVKSGLVELAEDDRAAILGALAETVAQALSGDVAQQLILRQRRGRRAFAVDQEQTSSNS